MPFIWNDETYWERYKNSFKIYKLLIPIFILCVSSLYFLYDLELKNLFLFAFVCSLTIVTFVDIFIQIPSPGIPDTYPQWAKKAMYISYFFLSLIVTYWIGNKVL